MSRRPLALALLLTAPGCILVDAGPVVTTTFDTVGVRHLVLDAPVDTTVSLGADRAASLACAEKLADALDVAVEGDTLTVSLRKQLLVGAGVTCTLALTLPDLEEADVSAAGTLDVAGTATLARLTVSGAGDVRVDGLAAPEASLSLSGAGGLLLDAVDADALELTVTGSGRAEVRGIVVDDLDVDVSGSGDARLQGTATTADVRVSGTGDVEALDLSVGTADVALSGSGDLELTAETLVRGSVSGSGDLVVAGDAEIDVSTTGAGDVSRR
jgi:hypothetical protein